MKLVKLERNKLNSYQGREFGQIKKSQKLIIEKMDDACAWTGKENGNLKV